MDNNYNPQEWKSAEDTQRNQQQAELLLRYVSGDTGTSTVIQYWSKGGQQ